MCRLMCHCERHIDVDNKHGRSAKAIHSLLSRWTAGTEVGALCRQTGRAVLQEELDREREPLEVLTQVSDFRLDAISSPQV